eukprot:CAMPEP_0119132420 /NCGR_PEP_ID=MMETSP1310-20130426/11825_1 /TAXON_ID=464262 /ORGANISM="Genus nov. species nov., Strain RCC2339" /LENGTH=1239 /DNA_ID=CAMNT_0007123053 /DNA_START=32 /DNA_END=3751 /DNA_ORIENTATION=+
MAEGSAGKEYMDVKAFYEGQTLLVTGATGFIGKVLVEKIMRSLPMVKKVVVMIRSKKGVAPSARLKKEVIGSPVFLRLREEIGEEAFQQRCAEKLFAVAGDITVDNFGLSAEDEKFIVENVSVIHHCAASIDFKEVLPVAINQNVLGGLRMLELAKKCKNLLVLNHVSTAYTGCHMEGVVKEELHEPKIDPEKLLSELRRKDAKYLEEKSPQIISGYPNTYTFTKNMCENILVQRRGTVPLCIYRPTIVGCSMAEPTPGWVDVISAASALYLALLLGLFRYMCGGHGIGDQVPVDIVVNSMLVLPMDVARKDTYRIFHMGTSHRNPIRWREMEEYVPNYIQSHIPEKAIDVPIQHFVDWKPYYWYKYYTTLKIPAKLYWWYSRQFGSEGQKKDALQLLRIERNMAKLTDAFQFFVDHEWIFDGSNTEEVRSRLSPAQNREFNFDTGTMHWEMYHKYWMWGITHHVLKDHQFAPVAHDHKVVMFMGQQKPMSDFWWAYTASKFAPNLTMKKRDTRAVVLISKRVQDAIREEAQQKGVPLEQVTKRAQEILKMMAGELKMPIMRTEAYFWRKIYRNFYNQILVDETGLQNIRDVAKKHPIVVIPTHRSYVDFLLVSYLFFHYGVSLPHIAAGEDFLNLKFINYLFRNSGAFFMRRNFGGDPLYRSIFTEYVQCVLNNGFPLEFFIEGTRSRTGMTLPPKFGVLSIIFDTFFDKDVHEKMKDIFIIPISLSYEKYVEGSAHVREILGEKKKSMSTVKLIREIPNRLLHTNFGRIGVQFGQPISLRNYIECISSMRDQLVEQIPHPVPMSDVDMDLVPSKEAAAGRRQRRIDIARRGAGKQVELAESLRTSIRMPTRAETPGAYKNKEPTPTKENVDRVTGQVREMACTELAYQIITDLNANILVLSTAILSSLILLHRSTGVSVEVLASHCPWVIDQLKLRGARVDEPKEGQELEYVDRGLSLLSEHIHVANSVVEVVAQSPASEVLDKRYGTVQDINSLTYLAILRNQMMHLFSEDGLVFAAFSACATAPDRSRLEADYADVLAEVAFLRQLFAKEFALRPASGLDADRERMADDMIGHARFLNILYKTDSHEEAGVTRDTLFTKVGSESTEMLHGFLGSMVMPFLETYWFATLLCSVWISRRPHPYRRAQAHICWLAKRFLQVGHLRYAECANSVSIGFALDSLVSLGLLTRNRDLLSVGDTALPLERVTNRLAHLAWHTDDHATIRGFVEKFPLVPSRL